MNLIRYTLISGAAATLLAGCGGSQLPIGVPGEPLQAPGIASTRAAHHASASPYQVVYRFNDHKKDGAYPTGLTNMHGTLYGVTALGGARGVGTVYTLTTSGEENVLHSFSGGLPNPGAQPRAPLINVKGILYGTTLTGGSNRVGRAGTVYSISPSGSVTILHSFLGARSSDGEEPSDGKLLDVNDTLYGTTTGGGSSSCRCGTVYSMSTSGAEKVLYSFKGRSDGSWPSGGFVDVNGMLYGTTLFGGTECGSRGCGTVYSITTAGKEKVLYRFGGRSDGAVPMSGLINVNGTLYGTTFSGGANGYGTVFSITRTGKNTVLYSFAGGTDGVNPVASLIDINGTLYGTTEYGGNYAACTRSKGSGGFGCGTVFSVSTNGAESVLYRFAGGTDGMWPAAPLTTVKGTLYGTTPYGGLSGHILKRCCGTVFALTP